MAGGSHVQMLADAVDKRFDFEGLVHKIVGTGRLEFGDFVFLDQAGNAHDFDFVPVFIGAHALANFATVDIGQHHVQHDEFRAIFLNHHAGFEAVVDATNFEPTVTFQHVGHQFDQIDVVIDDEDFAFAAFQRVGWNAVVAHKAEQFSARNAAEPAAGDAEAFELARVETANDGLLADFADFGCFAGGEDTLHANHLFP